MYVNTEQDFIGTANISADRLEHSRTYDTPIDCVWTIRAEKDFKIYLQFPEYHLIQPNDCHLNYIQVPMPRSIKYLISRSVPR